MKLKIFDHLEGEILYRVADHRRISPFRVIEKRPDAAEAHSLRMRTLDVVDFRIQAGARANVQSENPQAYAHAKERVVQILARQFYDDLKSELLDLLEWVQLEGIGQDAERRIERIICLTEGKNVEDPT